MSTNKFFFTQTTNRSSKGQPNAINDAPIRGDRSSGLTNVLNIKILKFWKFEFLPFQSLILRSLLFPFILDGRRRLIVSKFAQFGMFPLISFSLCIDLLLSSCSKSFCFRNWFLNLLLLPRAKKLRKKWRSTCSTWRICAPRWMVRRKYLFFFSKISSYLCVLSPL